MKRVIGHLLLVLITVSVFGQDIHFSQYNEAPLLMNPALTGFFDGSHRIGLNYKNQWRSIGNGYNTYALSYDASINKDQHSTGFLALGLAIFNDVAGDLKFGTLTGQLNIAYHLKLNDEQMLAAGIYGGFGQKSIDQTNMQWDNQYDGVSGFDATIPSIESIDFENYGYVDFGFGMNWSMNHNSTNMSSNDGFKTNVGFSVNHVNKPNYKFLTGSEEQMNMRIQAHAKAIIGLSQTNVALVPIVMTQFQGKQKEILPGMMVRYMLREQSKYTGFMKDVYLSLGGIYRTSDAVIVNAMIEMNDIALGLSYDINISRLSNATNGKGGFEIALRYIIKGSGSTSFY